MPVLITMCAAYLVISSASICNESQHCRDCNSDTGSCLTECDSGYFDLKCKSHCSKECKNKKCKSVRGGTEVCTDGCVQGYQGERCNIACDSPTGNCTTCPGGCDGGYCQLGSTCVSGCSGSYYGSDCKHCSNRCKTCNGHTGMCEECFPQYFGTNCEYLCEHCRNTCQFGCLHGCVPGFYGDACEKECSSNCGFSQMMLANNTEGTRPVTNDTHECNRHSGDCLDGCVDGWFGPQCSSQCSIKCRNWRCSDTGLCTDGCASHHFGTKCLPCPDNCINHTCHTSCGTCVHGCTNGFYGQSCNNTCEFCLDGKCDQMTGMCFKGCNTTGHKCTPICRNNCTVDDCRSCQGGFPGEGEMSMTIGMSTGLTVLVTVIVMLVCVCYIKRRTTKRAQQSAIVQQNDEPDHADVYSVEYQAINKYWLIRDEDMNIPPCEPPTMNQEEHGFAMPVLADCFSAASGVGGSRTSTSGSSAGDTQSYTHLSRDAADNNAEDKQSYTDMSLDVADPDSSQSSASDTQAYTHLLRDVFVDDSKTVVSYISPVVD